MKPSLQKLQKFFKLEAERGYDNHAVLGGLDRMLERWEAEARAESLPEDLIQAIASRVRDYPRLTAAGRAEMIEGLLRRIQRTEEGAGGGKAPGAEPREAKAPQSGAPARRSDRQPGPGGKPERPGREDRPAREDRPPREYRSVRDERPGSREQRAARGEQEGRPQSPAAAGAPPSSPEPHTTPPAGSSVLGPTTDPNVPGLVLTPEIDRPQPPQTRPPGRPPAPSAEEEDELAPGYEGIPDEAQVDEVRRPRTTLPSVPPMDPAAVNAPITVLQGVGPRHGQTLARLGLSTLRDMLYYLPRRYDDYTQLKPINRLWYGEEVTVIGTVQNVNVRNIKDGRMQIVEAIVSDGTGALRINWFNQSWVARRLLKGAHIVLSGKIDQYMGRLVMNSPEWEPLEQQQLSTNRIVPVYPLTAQITQRWLRKLMNQVITYWAPRMPDPLPPALRQSAGLMDLPTALYQAHFPDSWDDLKAARQRLAFDEIFLLQLGVLGQKRAWQSRPGRRFEVDSDWLEQQTSTMPFPLTGAQQRAVNDIRSDLAAGRPMNRLIQGDVGSGKTVVAALAMAMIVRNGPQAALMAPTSILAEQHYKSLLRLLAGQKPAPVTPPATPPVEAPVEAPQPELSDQAVDETLEQPPAVVESPALAFVTPEPPDPQVEPVLQPEQIRLMVGATPEAEKREIRAGLADGSIKVIIGTHALIEDPVTFADLQLTIVDEQHRFGVEQRAALRSKGDNPHLLVMTATPIPRSLALTVYGDLDLSVIDEMPPGRQPVSTHVLPPRESERAYNLIRTQVSQGRQAFIIYPLVEESEKSEAKAAVEEYTRLQSEIFPRLKLGLLHGRLKGEEKEQVMQRFKDRELDILVSTSVIEVGVDVPNATVMLIEGANRFGLAQLHQFRGRVGRGAEKSYCLLIPDTPEATENERLQVMAETNDGFVLAERDLQQRGPGQFLGTRQSGYSELQLANLADVHLIEKARRHAQELFSVDPEITQSQHQLLALALQRFWGDGRGDIS